MKKIIIFFILIVAVGITSCDKGVEPELEGVAIQEMCGEWFVETFVGDAKVLGYAEITTYNTAKDGTDEMWIDDLGHIWEFKSVTPINLGAKTFSGNDLESVYYPLTISLTNGKILDDAATTTGGNAADSIYFDIEFSDDPGTIYTIRGYKRTGFLEDEH